ncbi:MAG: hypothetical protein ACRD5K_04295 [Candidatus Acidiferrales bacterium]
MILPEAIPSEIVLRGIEAQEIRVEDLANFLRDLVFLHDRLWMMASEKYVGKDIGCSWFYGRNGRPIPGNQQLRLVSFRKESPFLADIIIASAALSAPVAWTYFRILRGALLLPGEISKQDAEVEQIKTHTEMEQLEKVKLAYEIVEMQRNWRERALATTSELRKDLREFPSSPQEPFENRLELVERDIERLSRNEIIITNISVRKYIQRTDEK